MCSDSFLAQLKRTVFSLFLGLGLAFFAGCATTPPHVEVTRLNTAMEDIPEEELLDVGIEIFEVAGSALEKTKENDTQAEIKKAEAHYIPMHLKTTLQQSGYWGAVRVIPGPSDSIDVTVTGQILKSNGQLVELKVRAVDSTGREWLHKKYKGRSGLDSFTKSKLAEFDAMQDVYNRIANDLQAVFRELTAGECERIRITSSLKFAASFAPDAFADYIRTQKNGETELLRLPSREDPMYARLMQLREREYMLVDTINQHYDIFYRQMWDSYDKWRRFDRTETLALKKVKQQGWARIGLGAAMVIGAVLLENNSGGVWDSAVLRDILVLGGFEVVMSGVSITKEAQMHAAALDELGKSFSAEVRPVVVRVEGETVRLTGTAEEQYKKWRELLRKIYTEETGFGEDELPAGAN